MIDAFLIPGFNPNRIFADPDFDELRANMHDLGVRLDGVKQPWGDYGLREYGRVASSQMKRASVDVLIGHSVGAIVALMAVEGMPVHDLMLCSPSALFAEDLATAPDPTATELLGQRRMSELSNFSAEQAATRINRLGLPVKIAIGSFEHQLHPRLVARAVQLASDITTAELVEIPGAKHSIRSNPYARVVAQLTAAMINREPS